MPLTENLRRGASHFHSHVCTALHRQTCRCATFNFAHMEAKAGYITFIVRSRDVCCKRIQAQEAGLSHHQAYRNRYRFDRYPYTKIYTRTDVPIVLPPLPLFSQKTWEG